MTNTLPARETTTRPIAARRYSPTIYDPNATAILRPDEPPILDFRYAPPTGGIPAMFAAGADTWIFDHFGELQEPTTGNPPPLPPDPTPPTKGERPGDFRPGHRRRLAPLVKGVLIGAATATAVYLGVDLAAWVVLGWLR